ncbi:MAG: fimbria/pilus periplasmic chaperone [Sphingobium sp.]
MRYPRLTAVFALLLMLPSQPLWGAGLKVAPVSISLDADHSIEVIQIENSGASPTRVQLRLFAWEQRSGQDELNPTRDVLANPAQFEMAPGGTQTVRIGRLIPPGDVEKSYRLLIEEIPSAAAVNTQQVKMLLRISIPVFVPPVTPETDLRWRAVASDGRQLTLWVENRGSSHVQLRRISVASQGSGTAVGEHGQMLYVLPGATRVVSLSTASPVRAGQALVVSATTDGASIAASMVTEATPHADPAD